MTDSLETTARALVAPGRGILAADESSNTIAKRFALIDLPSTEDNRRDYREMLFTAPGLGEYISGVILYDETIRMTDRHGTPFPTVLERQGMIPGIKVDLGVVPLAHFPGEKITEGLDGLRQRLEEYRARGARFTKWRAVYAISPEMPSLTGMRANAEALARYAALSQEAGLVPIVEPEVLMDGDHSLERCEEVTIAVQTEVFHALSAHRVAFEGMLLKPNMILSGGDAARQAGVEEVAMATLRALRRTVPTAVPGIVFLSGGQDAIPATAHLNAMNQIDDVPWQLSFSYGRALETPALLAWKGDPARVAAGKQALLHRARCNSLARYGRYSRAEEDAFGQQAA